MSGRSIRLFLVDGDYNGLITAELVNWTGRSLAGPRSKLSDMLKRDECKGRTGIYFLIGTDPNSSKELVYIGETENLSSRLGQHARPESQNGKEFWDYACVFSSKDENITKAHAKYLESRLVKVAKEANRCILLNSTNPEEPSLPEADRSDMGFFIDQIRMVLPALGFDFLRVARSHSASAGETADGETPIYVIESRKHGLEAQAVEDGSDFTVLEGSLARSSWEGAKGGYGILHADLCEKGILELNSNGSRTFTQDYVFSSPSAAAAIVYGRSSNGREAWTVKTTGETYAAWHEKQLLKADIDVSEETQ